MKRTLSQWSLYSLACLFTWASTLGMNTPLASATDSLKASGHISCGTREKLVLRGYKIVAKKVGLRITGRCKVTLIGSTVKAGKVGILIENRGKLVVVASTIEGGVIAIKAVHRGRVTLTSTKLRSKKWSLHASHRAKVLGLTGNSLHGQYHVQDRASVHGLTARGALPPRHAPPGKAVAPIAPTAPLHSFQQALKNMKLAAPINCIGNRSMTLRKRYIKTQGTAIALIGNCNITLIDCWISGKIGINVVGNGHVRLVRTYIHGKPAVQIMGNGNVSAKNSRIQGGVSKVGNGHFHNKGGNRITQE